MKLPDIDEHAMNRISFGLDRGKMVNEFNPPLSEDEKIWYETLKKGREEFEREHPGLNPIWEVPFDY